ncbi:MAG: hypothetical protein E6I66_00515 [Chloroflexi bacterium]|nr:MAG: hypothetical protein E6I66_00515 [Chloroflexota bacterium]
MARIVDLLATGQTFSFEFFPPKDNEEQQLLTRTIADLQPLKPSFVSGRPSDARRRLQDRRHRDRHARGGRG